MPRCTVNVPRSSLITMNLPRRWTPCIVRPVKCLASVLRFPGVTKREENDAATMRRPTRCGVSVRTTVSTSGSSGMKRLWQILVRQIRLRQIHHNFAVLDLHRIGSQLQKFIHVTQAAAAIELPGVKRAGEHVAV